MTLRPLVTRLPDQISISEAELAPYVSGNNPANRAHGLLLHQKETWELLRTGYNSLAKVLTKSFEFDSFQIKVQFNPGRLTSTAAKVDPASIRERKCFLCAESLPPAQRGLACDSAYLVLCNPFPIFPEHFTISHLRHIPQVISGSFATFLNFTREFGARYTVFYNGPKCGASAPDHLHFQAGLRSFLPSDAEFHAITRHPSARLFQSGSLRVCGVDNYLRHFISFESSDAGLILGALTALHEVLRGGSSDGEPMLNILGFYTDHAWRIIVFPRAKHRPSFYFNEGPDKLLISPAAVELGGVCTTPREEDFEKVTREHLVQMFNEVSVSRENFAAIKARLAPKLTDLGA
jgi:hypothetical protein